MSDQEPKSPPSLDEVQRLLCRTLSRLESDIDSAMQSRRGEDDLLKQLDRDRFELEDRVDVLRRTLSRLSDVASVDLNRVTAEVLDDVLLDLEKPLALRVQWGADLPFPSVPEESLRSLLHRAISLTVRHAGSGHRVSFRTAREDEEVVLGIALESAAAVGEAEPFDVLAARCRSLSEFVGELGGRFLLTDHNGVQLEIRLRAGVQSPSS